MNHALASLALRGRALPLSVCTTGSISLSATATQYTRTTGSFVADGFAVGMEAVATGFTNPGNNGVAAITAVSALTLTVTGFTVTGGPGAYVVAPRTMVVEGPITGSLTVGLPTLRAWENQTFDMVTKIWWVEENYVPATVTLMAGPRSNGMVEETGLYVLKVYGIANTGSLALHAVANALLLCYQPGDSQTLSDGTVLRIRGDTGPYRGALQQLEPGWAVVTVTVPWRCYVNNPT